MTKPSLAACLLLACAPSVRADERALDLALGDPARKDKQATVVVDAITDSARGDVVTPPELAARLDGVRLLFVGESHTDMDFHRAQLRVLEELHKRGRQVLVGLEMYPTSEQQWLDRWISSKQMSEQRFVADSHWYKSWGYHWNYYREIFLFARANGIRMFGVNVPRAVVQVTRMKGFEGLTPDQRALLPERIDTESPEHRQLFRAFFGATDALHGRMSDAMFEGMFRAQCTWDAAMGWHALQALRSHGGENAVMVVLIGAGHVAYGLGAERQVKLWSQEKTASLVPVPVADEEHKNPVEKVRASYADFVWGLPPSTDPLYPSLGISTPEQKSGDRYKVIMVSADSPAAAAGFQVGDEIVSFDGVTIDDKETSNRLMSEKRWGDALVCRVLRGGQELTLTALLRRRPPKQVNDQRDRPVEAPAAPPPMLPPSGGRR
jgi:uncharacterized iron-regulated protein